MRRIFGNLGIQGRVAFSRQRLIQPGWDVRGVG